MSPSLEARSVYQREPEPGLLDPLVGGNGLLAPILTPILGGGQKTTSNPPAPAPTTTQQQQQQQQPTPTTTSTNNGGGNGGGHGGGNGGGNGGDNGGGNGGGSTATQAPPSDPDTGQTQAAPSSPSETGDSADTPSEGSPVNDGDSPVVSGGAPATGNNGISNGVGNVAGNPAESNANGSTKASSAGKGTSVEGSPDPSNVVVISGTTTHLAATPGSNPGSQGQIGSGDSGSTPSGGPSSHAAPVSSGPPTQAKSSHVGGAAVGGIVVAILAFLGLFILFFLRRRHLQRRKERQVTWLTGTDPVAMLETSQRSSVRSSWGTPIERRTSGAIPWLSNPPTYGGPHRDPFAANFGTLTSASTPVLPMPALSPTRSHSPENPFADLPAPPRPLKRMSSLPIRISLISSNSDQDPFDDAFAGASTGTNELRVSAATFGHNTTTVPSPQANFPMPPSASSQTVFAVNRPSELLQTPARPVFPDSPVTRAFGAATGYRRASVKSGFQPSQERCDELQLEPGDRVNVVSVYEDGWAFVHRESDNERGLVPLTCLELDEPHAM